MLLVIAAVVARAPSSLHQSFILVALGLSLVGDIFLMLSDRWFSPGLVAFLGALSAYAVAFAFQAPLGLGLFAYVIYPLVPGLAALGWLWPHLRSFRVPVLVYVFVMSSMILFAIARLSNNELSIAGRGLGVVGAALFMLSDTLVARRRFVAPAAPYAVELGAYFAAQWCLASTTWLR